MEPTAEFGIQSNSWWYDLLRLLAFKKERKKLIKNWFSTTAPCKVEVLNIRMPPDHQEQKIKIKSDTSQALKHVFD